MRAEERGPLEDEAEEREHVDEAEQAQDQPTRQLIAAWRSDPRDKRRPRRRHADVFIGFVRHTLSLLIVSRDDEATRGVCAGARRLRQEGRRAGGGLEQEGAG